MSQPVVTLFERYGAGARYIGPRVAERLGVEWHDQAFSSTDIEKAQFPGGLAPTNASGGLLARFFGRFGAGTLIDDPSVPLAQRQDVDLVAENTRTVKESAANGGVLLGRNGALILGTVPGALHVQVDAPLQVRIKRAAQEAGITEAQAARRQRNEDYVRREMSERLYHWDPMLVDRYHLILNTGMMDLDTAVEIIVAASNYRMSRAAEQEPDASADPPSPDPPAEGGDAQ